MSTEQENVKIKSSRCGMQWFRLSDVETFYIQPTRWRYGDYVLVSHGFYAMYHTLLDKHYWKTKDWVTCLFFACHRKRDITQDQIQSWAVPRAVILKLHCSVFRPLRRRLGLGYLPRRLKRVFSSFIITFRINRALCGYNPAVTGGSPHKGQQCGASMISVSKLLNKKRSFRFSIFETPWRPCDITVL